LAREDLDEKDPGETLPAAEQTLPVITVEATGETSFATFSEKQWSAKDAWKCLGMLLVFGIVEYFILRALDRAIPGFSYWHRSGYGFFCVVILSTATNWLTAAYFSRVETLKTLWKGLGLDRKPSEYVWMGIVCALALRFASHTIVALGWAKGYTTHNVLAAWHANGFEKLLYLLPILLAPFIEEPVNRGFLYKAFRGSYGMQTSVVLIVAWTAWTHWSQYSHSWTAVVSLSLLTVVQCYLREKSGSLWDCILCHLAFNGSSFLVSGFLR
jgi:membrane protease YdiL (CAAX protease family)